MNRGIRLFDRSLAIMKKPKILLGALSIAAILMIGSSQGFTCTGGDCSAQGFWQAAPEYPSAWKSKMRLLGYLGKSGLYK